MSFRLVFSSIIFLNAVTVTILFSMIFETLAYKKIF